MKRKNLLFAVILVCSFFQIIVLAQERVPLYRYVMPVSKNDVYAASESRRASYKKKGYQEIGIVGYVYLTKQPGTTLLYHYYTPDGKKGYKNFYTSNLNEALAKEKQNWQLSEGLVGYVPESSGSETKNVFSFVNADGANIYAFSDTEINGFTSQGMKSTGVAFLVYKNAASLTDLQIGEVLNITENSVTFKLRSISGDFNGPLNVILQGIDDKGKKTWGQSHTVNVSLKSAVPSEVTYETISNKLLTGQKFQITIDGSPQLNEAKKENNISKILEGPPLTVKTIPPVIVVNPFPLSSVDITLRKALYFIGDSTKKIFTQSPYAAPGKTLTLKKSQGSSCDGSECYFLLGFFAQRPKGEGELSTYVQLSGKSFGSVGNTVKFAAAERSKDVIFPLKLKFGENKIKVEIDPYKKTAEADEDNNSFEVTIIVEN